MANGHAAELVIISTAGTAHRSRRRHRGRGFHRGVARSHRRRAGRHGGAFVQGSADRRDPRFVIAAIPLREDARDALVARDGMVLGELPAGSTVGTSSLDGRRTLEHWVSVWEFAPYQATEIPG